MKTWLRKAAAAVAFITLLAVFSGTALAAGPSVTYDGDADQFVFLPGTDLFQNFKGVMPGDTLTQEITVKNDTANGVKVKISLRAEPVDEQYRSFLSRMTLKVEQDGQSVLFEAPADQQGSLASDICLGTFSSGADILLNVSLVVPVEMGNEFQDQTGLIRWVFTAEELEDETNPDTNDSVRLWISITLAGAGAAGLLMLILLHRRHAVHKKAGR